jgi:tRNA-modifying protein YgfZ
VPRADTAWGMASLDEQARWVSESVAVFVPTEVSIRTVGDDAKSWLNGQVTNDVRELRQDAAVYALAVTVKGRVISDLWARAGETGPILAIPASVRDLLLPHFEKHIIMEDVELIEDADKFAVSVQGPRAREAVAGLTSTSAVIACSRFNREGFDVVTDAAGLSALLEELTRRAESLGGGRLSDSGLAHAHVLHAIPRIGIDFGEGNYPQEAGLKGRAVSFNKGCYTGQEVVYMLENRGQLSRRLVQLTGPAEPALAKGSSVYDAQGARVGEITSSTVTDSGKPMTVALAYLKRAAAEVGSVVSVGAPGPLSYIVRFVVGVTNDPCPIIAP